MHFPVDITSKFFGQQARYLIADGAGRTIGSVPVSSRVGEIRICAGPDDDTPIYWIRWQNAFTQWFEDGSGRRLGQFGLTPTGEGKFIFVGDNPQFRFIDDSGLLGHLDGLIPSVFFLNALTGMFFRPRDKVIRLDGGTSVLSIVRIRKAIDTCHQIHALVGVEGDELECLLLSTLVLIIQRDFFRRFS
jgi:hypothetical protein